MGPFIVDRLVVAPDGAGRGRDREGRRREGWWGRGRQAAETPLCQSNSIYGKESQDWSEGVPPLLAEPRAVGPRNNASVHIIHRKPVVDYTLCSVLDRLSVRQSILKTCI